jgi:hypothetical protein
MSVDFAILKQPAVGADPEPLGTLAKVRAEVERAVAVTIAATGELTGRDWALAYHAILEDGAVAMLRLSPRSTRRTRTPQLEGSWVEALRRIATALGATVLDLQTGVPLGDDDEDVPAPMRTDEFVIELLPASGRDGEIGDAAAIWRNMKVRLGITPRKPSVAGDGWQLRVVGATRGPLRRLELHLAWAGITARTALLKRCATINDGDCWVAYDPVREDVFPLDWFLEP